MMQQRFRPVHFNVVARQEEEAKNVGGHNILMQVNTIKTMSRVSGQSSPTNSFTDYFGLQEQSRMASGEIGFAHKVAVQRPPYDTFTATPMAIQTDYLTTAGIF